MVRLRYQSKMLAVSWGATEGSSDQLLGRVPLITKMLEQGEEVVGAFGTAKDNNYECISPSETR